MLLFMHLVCNGLEHAHRVDLAHVAPPVVLLHVAYVQHVDAVLAVAQRNAVVARNHVTVHRQHSLGLDAEPRHLVAEEGIGA